MAQSGFTPIQLYYSSTGGVVPLAVNLLNGELAINITDGKLYYKDNLGVVQTIANKNSVNPVNSISFGTTGLTPNTATSGAVTVGGTLVIANGGTGATTQQTAINALAGATTSGQYLRGNGTNVVMSAIQAGDIPTLNQNTTGTAANVTGVVAVVNGGTGLSGYTANRVLYASSASTIGQSANLAFDGTTLTANSAAVSTGNLTFSGTAQRITGDMTNATVANRLAFQNSVVNGSTQVTLFPNGTSQTSLVRAFNNSDPTNASTALLYIDAGRVGFDSAITGTGTYLPMTFFTGGSERVRIDTSGNVGIGTASPSGNLQVSAANTRVRFSNTAGTASTLLFGADSGQVFLGAETNAPIYFITNNTERMRIDASGNVGIGRAPNYKLDVYIPGTGSPAIASSNDSMVTVLQSVGSTQANVGTLTSHPLVFIAANTERMRIDASGNVGIGASPTYKLDVSAGSLGTTLNSQIIAQRLQVASSNADHLEISKFRDSAGTDWTTAGWRLQEKVDSTWMGWMQFNGFGNQGGIAFGAGTTTVGPGSVAERMRIDSSGNVNISTLGARITGDFTNATVSNRLLFQTSTANSTTSVGAMPNGTGTSSNFAVTNNSDVNNASVALFGVTSSVLGITSTRLGTGTVLPITFNIGSPAGELARFNTSGGLSIGTTADAGFGGIFATGNITAYYSDDRLKTKLGPIESALDKVCSLNGFYYQANETAQQLGYKPKREIGLSAQEVEKVLPELVVPAPIDEMYKTLHYERLVPVLVEAIKELQERIRKLESK